MILDPIPDRESGSTAPCREVDRGDGGSHVRFGACAWALCWLVVGSGRWVDGLALACCQVAEVLLGPHHGLRGSSGDATSGRQSTREIGTGDRHVWWIDGRAAPRRTGTTAEPGATAVPGRRDAARWSVAVRGRGGSRGQWLRPAIGSGTYRIALGHASGAGAPRVRRARRHPQRLRWRARRSTFPRPARRSSSRPGRPIGTRVAVIRTDAAGTSLDVFTPPGRRSRRPGRRRAADGRVPEQPDSRSVLRLLGARWPVARVPDDGGRRDRAATRARRRQPGRRR